MKKKLSAKEVILLLLPILLFAGWAVLASEQNVRQHIAGKWRSSKGTAFEFKIDGDKLTALKNGQEDKRYAFRFVSDNAIEVTDKGHAKVARFVLYSRIRRGVLEMGTGLEVPPQRYYRVNED